MNDNYSNTETHGLSADSLSKLRQGLIEQADKPIQLRVLIQDIIANGYETHDGIELGFFECFYCGSAVYGEQCEHDDDCIVLRINKLFPDAKWGE